MPNAQALYDQSRFADLLGASLLRVKADSGDVDAWMYAAIAAACLGDKAAFLQIHEQAQKLGGAAATCRNCLVFLLNAKNYIVLIAIAQDVAQDNVLWIICQYYLGCALVMQGHTQSGLLHLARVKQFWPYYKDHIDFFGVAAFNVLLRQANAVAATEEVSERRAQAIGHPAASFVNTLSDPRGIAFAGANNLYFNAFAGSFAERILPMLGSRGLCLHVIGPDQASHDLMATLTADYPGRIVFCLEEPPLFATTTYFACARFFMIEQVMRRLQTDVLSFDIDIAPIIPADDLFALAQPYDFCCFQMDRNEPASRYQASVMNWRNTVPTLTFLAGLQAFCWPLLGLPPALTWLLDQGALFSLLESGLPDLALAFGDFTRLTGKTLHACVAPIADEQTKDQLWRQSNRQHPG